MKANGVSQLSLLSLILVWLTVFFHIGSAQAQQKEFTKVQFPSADGLQLTADLYLAKQDKQTPMILLCHQAGWSRGEYREIAPKLNKMGFNCMALDQRSGNAVNEVENETFKLAKQQKKATGFVDAEQDMIAALNHCRKNYAKGKLILWGSSYSSALSLRIAGENPQLLDGVLAFAPGEYFARFGKPKDWITTSAAKIKAPVFITSAQDEFPRWKSIFEKIPGDKSKFVPTTKGNHGSRALWAKFDDHEEYWKATRKFLGKFQ